MQRLQDEIEARTKELKFEQTQRETLKERYETEIKLMATAWCDDCRCIVIIIIMATPMRPCRYDLGSQYQRISVKQHERAATAFLPAQRQAAMSAKH